MAGKIIIVLLILFFSSVPVFASQEVVVNYQTPDLIRGRSFAGLHQIYGEIAEISSTYLLLINGESDNRLNVASTSLIFCNGLPAIWQALLPVTAEAFFEAEVMVNDRNQAVIINGFYYGEECLINNWREEQSSLKIELISVVTGKTTENFLTGLHRSSDLNWLEKGQVIFVLYGMKGGIRAVFETDFH